MSFIKYLVKISIIWLYSYKILTNFVAENKNTCKWDVFLMKLFFSINFLNYFCHEKVKF
jgi:hypothetical protein